MLILIPLVVIILVIIAIDQIYYAEDYKPKTLQEKKVITKEIKNMQKQKNYVDRYIKK